MAKYRGRVDCYLEPSPGDSVSVNSRANGEFFVNLIQHVSSSMQDLGIEMLAWNYGDGGTGWNFWDEGGSTGRNAFACFRFHSASLGKFDCLIYVNTGSYNDHSGGIYIDNSSDSSNGDPCYHQVGISFACHPSGSVTDTYPNVNGPWDGGYGENTWIQTSSEIWKTTPAGKGAFFPRPNGRYGQNSGSRDYLMGLGGAGMNQSRCHFIVSEDSLTVLTDDDLDTNTRIMHFGPYIPRSGAQCDSPYIMWTSDADGIPWVNGYDSTIGNTSRTSGANQGAIAHPNLLSGALKFSFGYLAHDQTNGYNDFINSGSFEKLPVWTIINEGSDRAILGTLKHLTSGIGMVNLSVSTLSSSAAFGRTTLNELKVITPWDGDAPETTAQVRTGRNFSIG